MTKYVKSRLLQNCRMREKGLKRMAARAEHESEGTMHRTSEIRLKLIAKVSPRDCQDKITRCKPRSADLITDGDDV